jgi:HAD superfamily hydrolase (TIGR01549 family)
VRSIQAAFLDFDGVILESIEVKAWAFKKLFEEYPQQVDEIVSYHMENGGISRFVKIKYIYEKILKQPLSDEYFKYLCQRYSELVFARVLQCEFVKGAKEFLDKYHRQMPLFVISGTPQEEMREIVEQKDLSQYFQGVFGSPNSKDYWVKKILSESQFPGRQTIFVGDAKSDYEAAKQGGCIFFARIPPGGEDIFEEKDIAYRIKDLSELDLILERDY